jgi:hypothetical protein
MLSEVWLGVALAATPQPPPPAGSAPTEQQAPAPEEQLRAGVRVLGEMWDEPELARVYSGRTALVGVTAVVPVHRRVLLDVELGFRRQEGVAWDPETGMIGGGVPVLKIVPLSVLIEPRATFGSAEVFVGVGPTAVVFREEHPEQPDANGHMTTVTQGVKVAGEFRAGMRVRTPWEPVPRLPPSPPSQLQGMDLEVYVGRRWQRQPDDLGLDLAAWRLGVGVVVRL